MSATSAAARREYGWLAALIVTTILPLTVSSGILMLAHGILLTHRGEPLTLAVWFAAATIMMTLALTPTTVVAVASGWLFGWSAFPWVVLSYTMAAVAGRHAGGWLADILLRDGGHPRLDALHARFGGRPFLLAMVLRLSPVLPFASINLVTGRMRLPAGPYLFGTMCGMLPRTLIAFAAGIHARDLIEALTGSTAFTGVLERVHPAAPGIAEGMMIALTLITIIGLGWLMRRAGRIGEKDGNIL